MKIRLMIKEKAELLAIYMKLGAAAQELAEHAEKYEGLYEPVYRFLQDLNPPSPMKEWAVRARAVSADGPLTGCLQRIEEWDCASELMKKQMQMLHLVIKKAGIRREAPENGKMTVAGKQIRAYIALDGHKLSEGETIHVLKPAWYLGEQIAEHGLAGEIV